MHITIHQTMCMAMSQHNFMYAHRHVYARCYVISVPTVALRLTKPMFFSLVFRRGHGIQNMQISYKIQQQGCRALIVQHSCVQHRWGWKTDDYICTCRLNENGLFKVWIVFLYWQLHFCRVSGLANCCWSSVWTPSVGGSNSHCLLVSEKTQFTDTIQVSPLEVH